MTNIVTKLQFFGALIAAALAQPISSVHAQDAYPNHPIRMVIPYTPGGSIDTVGRTVADQLQQQLGQAIIVENRPGASGMIGSKAVASAAADGYTLLFNASSQVQLPYVVSKPSYDPKKDFTPLALIGHVPLIVVAAKDFPAKNLAELISMARANPKKYTWATSGYGTTSHISEELIRHEMKLDMEIIPYKGAAAQLTDVVGGHVSAAVSPMPGAYPYVEGGKLKALAVTSKRPVASLPGVPTVAESGIPGFEVISWYGVWAPPNLPPALAQRLTKEISKALMAPAVQTRLSKLSFEVAHGTQEDFVKVIDEEIEKIKLVVQKTGIRID